MGRKMKTAEMINKSEWEAPESTLNINEVSEWTQGFVKLLYQIKKEVDIPIHADVDNLGSWEWMFKTASDLIITNSEKKSELLHYIADFDPGIKVLVSFFCGKRFQPLYLKIFIILRDCVNPRNRKIQSASVKQALDCSYLECCIHMMSHIGKDLSNCEEKHTKTSVGSKAYLLQETLLHMVWFLSAMAQRDINFAATLGKMCKVKFLLRILKNLFFSRSVSYYPVLKILRKLSKNSKVAIVLGKHKVMNLTKKMFGIFNNQPSPKFQMLFDTLVLLTKERLNCKRFLNAGCLIAIINCFQQWTSWRGKGLLKMCKSVLSIYTHLALTAVGRKALLQSAALTHIKKFCESCPAGKGFDDIMMRACSTLTLCHNVHKLPVTDGLSPARFDLPEVNENNDEDSGTSSDEDNADDPDLGGSENDDDEEGEDDDGGEEKNESDNEENIFTKIGGDIRKKKSHLPSRQDSPQTLSKYVAALKSRSKSTGSSPSTAKKYSAESRPSKESKISDQASCASLVEFSRFFSECEVLKKGKPDTETLNTDDSTTQASTFKTNDAGDSPSFHFGTMKGLKAAYAKLANRTRSVIPFVKLAYPDWTLAGSALKKECLLPAADRSTLRNKVLTVMSRASGADSFRSRVIYDLDSILSDISTEEATKKKHKKDAKKDIPITLKNSDEKEVGIYDKKISLKFESRFESGNLRKVIQIGHREYDLILTSDVNSNSHNQWFYFQISNTLEDVVYTFNIINCIKGNSQFNYGMQPVVFSVAEALDGNPGWVRSGFNICYFRNGFRNISGKKRKAYYTASFSLTFTKRGDIVYIAYHMPYTYTRLLVDLERNIKKASAAPGKVIRRDTLCQSLNQNDVPVITVTGPNCRRNHAKDREIVFLTARVHPGETNASWVMQGILNKLLLSPDIDKLLKKCVFKIIPMLNVEGVINGCHRCGLTAEDLNRRWKAPKKNLHPTIYNTKMLIEYCCKMRNKVPLLFCDLHGHSRKKNVFAYGCSRAKSWNSDDRIIPEKMDLLHELPLAISRKAPAFSIDSCNYDVRKSRETTARVTFWRDFNIMRSYTLECSYCGCDRGDYKGLCIGTKYLVEVGESLCEAVEDIIK